MHLYKIEGLRVPVFGREIRGVSCGLHLEFFDIAAWTIEDCRTDSDWRSCQMGGSAEDKDISPH